MSSNPERKVKVIYNPAARGGKSKKIVPKFKNFLDSHEIEYSFVETEHPLHAIELAESSKKEGFNVVASLGGDGTAHEVANGAIRAGVTYSVIPAGSGNDFAGALGIKGKWEDGADTLINGIAKKISITKANDRYSINLLDGGFGGDIAKSSQNHLKWMTGSMKYSLLTVGLLTRHKPYKAMVTLDGKEKEYKLNLIVAGFGQTFGSGMNILPDARFTHDKMHIAIIHDVGRFKFLRIFPKVFSAKHVNETKYVEIIQGSELIIDPLEDHRVFRAESEGELFSEGRLDVTTVIDGLEVLIPRTWDLNNVSLKVK